MGGAHRAEQKVVWSGSQGKVQSLPHHADRGELRNPAVRNPACRERHDDGVVRPRNGQRSPRLREDGAPCRLPLVLHLHVRPFGNAHQRDFQQNQGKTGGADGKGGHEKQNESRENHLPSRCRARLRLRRVRVHRAGNRKIHVLATAVLLPRFGKRLPPLRGGLHFNSRADCHCGPLAWKSTQSLEQRTQGMSGESESTHS